MQIELRANQIGDLAGNERTILFDGELRKDIFQSRNCHQSPQSLDRIIRNDFASMEDHNVRTDTFHGFKIVGAEQHHLAAGRQFLNQAAKDQGCAYVESGERLVQQQEIWIM